MLIIFLLLLCDASWVNPTKWNGLGFVILVNIKNIILVRAMGEFVEMSLHVEACSMEIALEHCRSRYLMLARIFCDCTNLIKIIHKEDVYITWRFSNVMGNIMSLLKMFSSAKLVLIPI